MWEPGCWSSTVEWLISVTRSWFSATQAGGFDGSTSATKRADGSGRLVSFHRKTSRKPRAEEAPELKKRFPSKCLGNGGAPVPCCTNLSIYSHFPAHAGQPEKSATHECAWTGSEGLTISGLNGLLRLDCSTLRD